MHLVRCRRTILLAAACALFAAAYLASPLLAAGTVDAASAPTPASAAFERLKELQGTWIGRSSEGHQETMTLRLIANGTVLAEDTSEKGAESRMATMIQLDGGRLLLTHYCEAGNTPRLVASGFEDGGRTITFTFLDGVNLPSRDRGHMDKVVMRLEDADHLSSRWTWYENGQDRWLEDIRLSRIHR